MAVLTIIFDLDGTLFDTAPDLVETLNVVFAREGLAPLPYATARNLVGGGAKAMIARGIEAEGRVLSPAKLEQMLTDFITYYSDHVFGIQKPDPEILRRTVAAAGGTMKHAIMIGDSNTDICTARAAGVPVIAVDFGYSERPISEFGPDQTISHFAQLPASIAVVSSALEGYGTK